MSQISYVFYPASWETRIPKYIASSRLKDHGKDTIFLVLAEIKSAESVKKNKKSGKHSAVKKYNFNSFEGVIDGRKRKWVKRLQQQ